MPRVVAIYGAGRNRAARGEMNSPFSLRENARLRMLFLDPYETRAQS